MNSEERGPYGIHSVEQGRLKAGKEASRRMNHLVQGTALPDMRRLAKMAAVGLTLALNLVACGPDNRPVPAKPAAAAAAVGTALPAGAASQPSVPDAAVVFSPQDAAERAKASQAAGAALNKTGPKTTMSKDQESKDMPLAGQANDHSVATRDDKPKAPPAK